jgi:hypothetical protein
MKKFKNFYLLFLIILPVLLNASFCLAGGSLELSYPIIGGKTLSTNTDLPNFVNYIFNLAIGVSGLLAFGVLIYSGTKYLTSAGDSGKMNEAKDQIFSAFVGLIILLCAYIILSTINPDLINIQMPAIQ